MTQLPARHRRKTAGHSRPFSGIAVRHLAPDGASPAVVLDHRRRVLSQSLAVGDNLRDGLDDPMHANE